MKKIILASSSPRRKNILKNMKLKFEIVPSPYEEALDDFNFSYEKIENLAYNKALGVLSFVEEPSLIIGADTVVVSNDMILGKPKDEADAFNMLKELSGKEHFVVTGICVISSATGAKKISSTTSHVEFNKLSDRMIKDYIRDFEPFDKAGAYGIQELPSGFVKAVKGSFENVMGLCPIAMAQLLQSCRRL